MFTSPSIARLADTPPVVGSLSAQARQRGARLRHLHQRQQRFLHACAAAGGEAHQRLAMLEAMLGAAHEALADDRAHRAAEKREFERARHDRQAVQRAGHHDQSILLLRALLSLQHTIAILLGVAELERILGLDALAQLFGRFRVQEVFEPLARADAHVIAALRADVQVALQLGPVQDRVASRALHPQAFRYRARTPLGLDPRRHDFFEPGHGGIVGSGGSLGKPRPGV
jgi:hypothetical protein